MENLLENSFANIKKQLQKYLNQTFKDLNLKSAEIIFLRVLHNQSGMTQIELSRKLSCDKAHIHRTATKLMEKGLITYQSQERHGSIKLTESGNWAIEKSNLAMHKWIEAVTLGIDKQELEVCRKVVLQIISNAEKIELENEDD